MMVDIILRNLKNNQMKKTGNILFLTIVLLSCNTNTTFSEIRGSLEKTETLITDYKFCMYEKEGLVMEKQMDQFVLTLNDDDLFNYFSQNEVKDKKIISKILVRNLCMIWGIHGGAMSKLEDEQLEPILIEAIKEIRYEIKGITTVIKDKNGHVIYEGH